ncbi:MAG: HAMP domain-containing histidine kinase, partial [Rhodothermaceae bacterium]|nr:HAMP domain-containing histidine kinase [Rhodothermaceae bacterium]
QIVRSMMQHASGATGKKQAVNLNEFVDEYIHLAIQTKQSQNKQIDVEVNRFYEFNGTVNLIPQEMGRVLINLVNNAFDALIEKNYQKDAHYKASLNISTGQRNGTVEIIVSDNGTGVPAEVIDKIFNPFFTTKPTGSGTGLGLSLSYDIVTQGHNGTLQVESEEGQGASFIIKLPV